MSEKLGNIYQELAQKHVNISNELMQYNQENDIAEQCTL